MDQQAVKSLSEKQPLKLREGVTLRSVGIGLLIVILSISGSCIRSI